ncbi:MAG: glycosyltransferase family 4 protein [Patescibacteria group bacterium]
MKLLVITQKIDKDDDVLGFFIRWVEEFEKKVSSVSVICLEKGVNSLPKSIPVFSLGKETKQSRFSYISNFYKRIISMNSTYDTVFVHMNQEYVLLGALIWKLRGKKIFMWRNHPNGTWKTKLAVFLSDRVFCTSEFSFTAKFKKTEIMPAGIDTDYFRDNHDDQRSDSPLLYLGRISSIKKVEILVESLLLLSKESDTFKADLYGGPVKVDSEKGYFENLKEKAKEIEERNLVSFPGSVPNNKTVEIYNSHGVLVNLTPTGSFDKVILEMMACGGLALVSNRSYENIFPKKWHSILMFNENDAIDLAEKIKQIHLLDKETKKEIGVMLRSIVLEQHSLKSLIQKIVC